MTETLTIMRLKHLNFMPSCLFRASNFGLRVSAAYLSILASASAAEAVEVRLRSTATAAAAVVRLADVAEILGDDAHVAAALAEVSLCPAPGPGNERLLSQHDVRQLLALSGVERGDVLVTGSESVTVTAESSTASRSLAKRPLVATGVRQALFAEKSDASRGPQPHKPAANPAAPPLAEAKPVAALPLVDRGATVTVQARAAGVRITTSGKALDAGAAGDTINVELADTKQRVLAHVTGQQAVEVSVGGAPAPVAAAHP
jgi:Chaperone for flagella basal body P-ring formation